VEEKSALAAEPARPRLNLSRPPDWDEIVRSVPGPQQRLAFNPGLERALDHRQAEMQRQALVRRRAEAIYGVSDADYARTGPLGEQMKRDGGCVTLTEDRDVEEGQRWWASTCVETRQNPFTLPAIEYDALGRAIAVD